MEVRSRHASDITPLDLSLGPLRTVSVTGLHEVSSRSAGKCQDKSSCSFTSRLELQIMHDGKAVL
jgi:hypothetical protein